MARDSEGLGFGALSSDNFCSKVPVGLSAHVGWRVRGVLWARSCAFGERAPKGPVSVKWLFDNDERDGNEPIDRRWEANCSS